MEHIIQISPASGQVAPPLADGLDALAGRFIAYLDASPKTIETYRRAVNQFTRYLFLAGIKHPNRSDILAFRDNLKIGHKPTTVQNYLVAVRQFFKWTASERLYPDVADKVKGAKLDRNPKKDHLSGRQLKTILSGITRSTLIGKRNYAILCLMTCGGLRSIEITRADMGDLRAVGDTPVLYVQGKGREEKTEYVKLPPPVDSAIRDYQVAREPAVAAVTAPLFASASRNNAGGRMTTRSVSGMVKTAFRQAGFDSSRLTAHSLRHTAVTIALVNGQSLQEVQQFARHASIATTAIYAHNLERSASKCEATIAEAIL